MTNQKEGLVMPDQGTAVGGKGTDGTFRFLKVANDGTLSTAGGNANGQATMANSAPVTVASDQPTILTRGAPTDRSGSITLGGTSQQLAAALATRTYFEFQNISDETQYINFGAAATTDTNSFRIVAGASYVNPPHFCPTGTINVIGATTGKKFVAKEA